MRIVNYWLWKWGYCLNTTHKSVGSHRSRFMLFRCQRFCNRVYTEPRSAYQPKNKVIIVPRTIIIELEYRILTCAWCGAFSYACSERLLNAQANSRDNYFRQFYQVRAFSFPVSSPLEISRGSGISGLRVVVCIRRNVYFFPNQWKILDW